MTARSFLRRKGIETAARRAWLCDLIREGLLTGPVSAPKPVGRGRRERFTLSDYRDLIEVMRLRAAGVIHRDTWMVWLRLRGHEYPLPAVRVALAAGLRRNLGKVRRELAPTGRYTEPFSVKYRRNVASNKAGTAFLDLRPSEEPIAALMFRPGEAKDIPLDLDTLVKFGASALGVDELQKRSAFNVSITAAAGAVSAALHAVSDALPNNDFARLVRMFAEGSDHISVPNVAGLIDDGFGHAGIESALLRATDDDLLRIRTLVCMTRTGQFEAHIRTARGRGQLQARYRNNQV